jgi:superfamily II DNA/RNA helicase
MQSAALCLEKQYGDSVDWNIMADDGSGKTLTVVLTKIEKLRNQETSFRKSMARGGTITSRAQARMMGEDSRDTDPTQQCPGMVSQHTREELGTKLTVKTSLKPSMIYLAPTRDLCQQTTQVFQMYTAGSLISVCCVSGGYPLKAQVEAAANKGCHVLCVSAGAMARMWREGMLKFDDLQYIVFDEYQTLLADPLRVGNANRIKDAIEATFFNDLWDLRRDGNQIARVFLSASTQMNIEDRIQPYVRQTEQGTKLIRCFGRKWGAVALRTVKHENLDVDRLLLVAAYVKARITGKVLIFTRTFDDIKRMESALEMVGEQREVSVIHSRKPQIHREQLIHNFASSSASIVISAKIMTEGFNIPYLNNVVNVDADKEEIDIPAVQSQAHRTGRRGTHGAYHTFYNDTEEARTRMKNLRSCFSYINGHADTEGQSVDVVFDPMPILNAAGVANPARAPVHGSDSRPTQHAPANDPPTKNAQSSPRQGDRENPHHSGSRTEGHHHKTRRGTQEGRKHTGSKASASQKQHQSVHNQKEGRSKPVDNHKALRSQSLAVAKSHSPTPRTSTRAGGTDTNTRGLGGVREDLEDGTSTMFEKSQAMQQPDEDSSTERNDSPTPSSSAPFFGIPEEEDEFLPGGLDDLMEIWASSRGTTTNANGRPATQSGLSTNRTQLSPAHSHWTVLNMVPWARAASAPRQKRWKVSSV